MAKKNDEKKLKKITFKFNPKDGGCVVFNGLYEPDDNGCEDFESLPKEVVKVLEDYGFTEDGDNYIDCISPGDSMSIDEDIEAISGVVPLSMMSKVQKTKNGSKVTWECSLDDGDTATHKYLGAAMAKAHAVWNKNGRHIDSVPLVEALQKVLDKVNAKRG